MNNDRNVFEEWELEYMNEVARLDTEKYIKEYIRNDLKEEYEMEYQSKLDKKDKQYQSKLDEKDKQLKKNIVNMFKEGFDNTVISRITGKSIKEIEKILMLQ